MHFIVLEHVKSPLFNVIPYHFIFHHYEDDNHMQNFSLFPFGLHFLSLISFQMFSEIFVCTPQNGF